MNGFHLNSTHTKTLEHSSTDTKSGWNSPRIHTAIPFHQFSNTIIRSKLFTR